MKMIKLFSLGILCLMIACSDAEEVGFVDSKKGSHLPHNNASAQMGSEVIPIAQYNPASQKWELNFNKLVKRFEDGGEIEYFAIRRDGSSYAFLRMGYDADGVARTESYHTSTENGQMGLNAVNDIVWFVVCQSTCDDLFCMPEPNGEYCECLGASDEIDNEVDGGPVDIYEKTGVVTDLDDVIGDDGLEGNCDFGGAGSGSYGIYVTKVLR